MKNLYLFFLAGLLLAGAGMPHAGAATRYVKPGGTGDGSSWANASGSIQNMVNASAAGDMVWVAAGSYGLSANLTMKEGVNVYGGFAGTETAVDQRARSDADGNGTVEPWEFTNATLIPLSIIQSGDFSIETVWDGFTGYRSASIKKNGKLENWLITPSGNASYLVEMSNGAALAGCTVRSFWYNGIYTTGNVSLVSCVVQNGGGTYYGVRSVGGTLEMTSCRVEGIGTGISGTNIKLTDCAMSKNRSGVTATGHLDITGCTIEGNTGDGITAGTITLQTGAVSVIRNNTGYGISITGDIELTDFTLEDGLKAANIKLTGCTVREIFGTGTVTMDDCEVDGNVTGSGDVTLINTEITSGNISGSSNVTLTNTNIPGGGVSGGTNSTLTLTDCNITNNGSGNGIGVSGTTVIMTRCTVARHIGTGISVGISGRLVMRDCTVDGNRGRGVVLPQSMQFSQIVNSRITGNGGGGLLLTRNNAYIGNCLIANNYVSGGVTTASTSNGGGLYLEHSSPAIYNSTIAYNDASEYGGGLFCYNGSSPVVTNSIIWGNTCNELYQVFVIDNTAAPKIVRNIYQNLTMGIASSAEYNADANSAENTGSDPLFTNFALRNYHLKAESPAVNRGLDTTGLSLPKVDLDGNLRIAGTAIDLGCYEHGSTGDPAGIVSVAVLPAATAVQKGTTQQFTAEVTAESNVSKDVTWKVTGHALTTTNIDAGGLLTIAAGETATSFTVTATSVADPSKSATAAVMVTDTPVTPGVTSVSVSPTTASLKKGDTRQFTATVTTAGNVSTAVTWKVTGNALTATNINGGGVLTVAAGETATMLTVTATSVADPSKSATAAVTVTDTPVTPGVTSVSVSPATVSLKKGATRQFTATVTTEGNVSTAVTWSLAGHALTATNIDAGGLLTIAAGETATAMTVTATSVADPLKKGTATITVESESITGAPELDALDMKAYPNPFTSTIRLTATEGCTLRVINTAGTTVHIQNIENPNETVRLEHLPTGMYFFHIEKNGKAKTVKVIKN